MVVTKRRSVRVALALLLSVLVGSFFLAAQPETKSASPLETLLAGSSTDIPGALSSLNDSDLPLALAVAVALKFKALHGDLKLSPEQVEEFHSALSQRLAKSTKVSITKTEGCSFSVPSRKLNIAGLELSVPAHYLSEQPLEIIDFGPRGEAGTLLPDLWVSFVTTKNPVKAKLLLDGKLVPTVISEGKMVFYRPFADVVAVLSIGTHTAEVTISDSLNQSASETWIFTVGMEHVPTQPIPSDAVLVGSFTLAAS